MHRRAFLRHTLVTATLLGAGGRLLGAGGRGAWAHPVRPGPGPYGPLEPSAEVPAVLVPRGFSVREVARGGREVPGTGHTWHRAADGGAALPAPDGGWVYVSNSEVSGDRGGVGALRFAADGGLVDAYPVLTGTNRNCAGGPTPWDTWLSCEEIDRGRVWECDPLGESDPVPHEALGRFQHEAAAVDPASGRVYLTEDEADGLLYRFTPDEAGALGSGRLEAAEVADGGAVRWHPVPDPAARGERTRYQVGAATPFRRGEGAWFEVGRLVFATTADGRLWSYDPARELMEVLHEPGGGAPLSGPDNVLVSPAGEVFVAEDGGNMELVVIADGEIAPFLRIEGQPGSEVAGPALDPSGRRLYVSSQRGFGDGVTYEVIGPFTRGAPDPADADAPPPPASAPPASAPDSTSPPGPHGAGATTPAGPRPRGPITPEAAAPPGPDDGGGGVAVPAAAGGGLGAVLAGATWRARRARRRAHPEGDDA